MVAFIVGALVIGGFAFNDRAYLGWSIVASVVGMLFVYYIFQHKRTFIPTPPDQIVLTDDEIVEKGEARAKWERIEKCWWFRYSIAGLMFLGAWFLFVTKPQLWWVSAVAVINGLVLLTREIRYLAVFGLVCIVALIAFSVIASLPVSLAVIIGALIIAGAVSR